MSSARFVRQVCANTPGKRFDHDYYAKKHMPMVMDRLQNSGMIRYEIDRGLAGGAPGSEGLFVCVGRVYFNTLEEFQQALGSQGRRSSRISPDQRERLTKSGA